MKIYKHTPLNLIRVNINKRGEEAMYLNLIEATLDGAIEAVKDIITSQNLNPFQEGCSTRLDFRECVGGINGQSKSISFKGLSVKETYVLLNNVIKNI